MYNLSSLKERQHPFVIQAQLQSNLLKKKKQYTFVSFYPFYGTITSFLKTLKGGGSGSEQRTLGMLDTFLLSLSKIK